MRGLLPWRHFYHRGSCIDNNQIFSRQSRHSKTDQIKRPVRLRVWSLSWQYQKAVSQVKWSMWTCLVKDRKTVTRDTNALFCNQHVLIISQEDPWPSVLSTRIVSGNLSACFCRQEATRLGNFTQAPHVVFVHPLSPKVSTKLNGVDLLFQPSHFLNNHVGTRKRPRWI